MSWMVNNGMHECVPVLVWVMLWPATLPSGNVSFPVWYFWHDCSNEVQRRWEQTWHNQCNIFACFEQYSWLMRFWVSFLLGIISLWRVTHLLGHWTNITVIPSLILLVLFYAPSRAHTRLPRLSLPLTWRHGFWQPVSGHLVTGSGIF